MFKYFFHELTWDNDVYLMFLVWALLIPVLLWAIRFVYKSFRSTTMKYHRTEYKLLRDLFMCLNGFEYLAIVVVVFAIYMGFWAYYVDFMHADWLNWKPYVILFPQICCIVIICVIFVMRYINFRKPLLR